MPIEAEPGQASGSMIDQGDTVTTSMCCRKVATAFNVSLTLLRALALTLGLLGLGTGIAREVKSSFEQGVMRFGACEIVAIHYPTTKTAIIYMHGVESADAGGSSYWLGKPAVPGLGKKDAKGFTRLKLQACSEAGGMTGEVLSVVNHAAQGDFNSQSEFGVTWTYLQPGHQKLVYEVVIKGLESKHLSLGMRVQDKP